MATAHGIAQAPVLQADVAREIPEWKLRNVFFTRLPGYRFVGIQRVYGVIPEGDLVMFCPASGTTLAVPLSAFNEDIEHAVALVRARSILASVAVR